MSENPVVLEPAAQELVEATADPLFLINAGPEGTFLRAALAAK